MAAPSLKHPEKERESDQVFDKFLLKINLGQETQGKTQRFVTHGLGLTHTLFLEHEKGKGKER